MKIRIKGAAVPTVAKRVEAVKEPSFFQKCLEIIKDDIKYLITGVKSEDRKRWEDYQKFCELARK